MPSTNPQSTRLTLCDSSSLGRMQVDLEAFFEFSFDLAEDLQDLIENHLHAERRRQAIRSTRR